MSLLRVRHPDSPPQDIDLGPSTGRITHARYAITGGAIVAVPNWRDRAALAQREYKERQRKVS